MRRFFYYNSSFASGFPNEYSMLFDGVDEYITCGTIPALSGNFSISTWVYIPDTTPSITLVIFGAFTSVSNRVFAALNTSGSIRFQIDGTQRNAGAVVAGWNHIVVVNDSTLGGDIWVNGVGYGFTYEPTLASGVFEIGRVNSANYWVGNIDELAIFDYGLDTAEVTAIYNSGSPTDLLNTSGVTPPVHWWRMGDGDTWGGSSWTINDVGTLGTNNGTSVNMEQADRVTDVP